MQKQSFERWLKNIKEYEKGTVSSRISNCLRIEEFYGDLDEKYKIDSFNSIFEDLSKESHRIPINGDYYTGSATLKSALKLYLEFKENSIINKIINAKNIEADKHDGSYELVREAVDSLSKSSISDLAIKDLDMLYSMAVGTWRMTISVKKDRIENSNLLEEEKIKMKNVLEKIQKKAENNEYENREKDQASIGMFGTGFYTFRGNTKDAEARKFISLVIEIKDLDNDEEIFNILEEGFKDGINGIQAGSASMILHCLKPDTFPILNGLVAKSIIVLEGIGVILDNPTLLTHYIENTKILKKFRDEHCEFQNYRTLDKELWNIEVLASKRTSLNDLLQIPKDEIKNYKIKLNIANPEGVEAFDTMVDNKELRLGWMSYKHTKEDLTRDYVIGLAREYKLGDDYWRFLGVFKVLERYTERSYTDGYKLEELDRYKEYKSKIVLKYKNKAQNLVRNAESIIDEFIVVESYSEKDDPTILRIKDNGVSYLNYIDFNTPLDFQDLYFSNPQKLKSQISIALKSGKSIILIGPPGTGKSKIAKKIAESYEVDSKMVTAMSDWSSYDTIGGYKPDESGSLYFEEGIFLSSFKSRDGLNRNQWLIIDEINRADIDKAFGPFFSVLSGDDVELGLKDDKRRNIEIIMEENIEGGMEGLEAESNQYIIPRDWRIIGTMNTFDKTSLYEMSYAFMRRFAFIPVAIPKGIDETLVKDFFDLWKIDLDGIVCGQVAGLWRIINKYRKLGPAIIEDIGNYIQQGGDFTSALVIYILPQLEGLFEEQIDAFVGELRGLEFIEDQEDLIESVEDLFNISLAGN